MTRPPCRYLEQSEEAVEIDARTGRQTPAVVMLCGWAENAAPEQLLRVPIWLQRNALSGHLMRDGDCEKCSAYQAKEPQ